MGIDDNRLRRGGRLAAVAFAGAMAMLAAQPASAGRVLYAAQLSGASEVPPNASTATAVITVLLDNVANTITVKESWSNLAGSATGAHIHNAPAGSNGPIIFPFSGVPFVPSGSIPPQTFPITPAQITLLQTGQLYANVHSTVFPGGEIRGQLTLISKTSCSVNPNIIADGSFEATDDTTLTNPNWASTSTHFGSSLCTVNGCGTLPTAAPRTGIGWVWFDGAPVATPEAGTASQTVALPLGATVSLSYFERFGIVSTSPPPTAVMTVTVDGQVVDTVVEPSTADGAYTRRPVDLSAFADGATHLVSFNYSRPAGGTIHSLSVDDVGLAVTACPIPFQPAFLGAASRKVHAGAGPFDLTLSNIATNPSTESRQGPVSLVYSFDRPVVLSGTFAITEGTALFTGATGSGNQIVLNFTNVTDQTYLTVTLSGVNGVDGSAGGTGTARVGLLVGDVNQTRTVSVADLGLVNAALTQATSAANFLKDVNLSGTITLGDKGITNASLTHALPAP